MRQRWRHRSDGGGTPVHLLCGGHGQPGASADPAGCRTGCPRPWEAGRWSVGARRRDVLADMKLVALGSA